MTTCFLIRHGRVDAVGQWLAGRRSGIHLNEQGRREAERLAQWLADEAIDCIYSSPLERAMETAVCLAHTRSLKILVEEKLIDFDYGDWTGKSFAELMDDPPWQRFNRLRSIARVPGGEMMLEVQARAVGFLERAHGDLPEASIAVVTHCDVIRAVLCHYLGMPLDLFQRIEIAPASVSVLRMESQHPTIAAINTGPHVRL